MDERVLVVHQQNPAARAGLAPRPGPSGPPCPVPPAGSAEQRRCLQPALGLLGGRIAVVEQGRAGRGLRRRRPSGGSSAGSGRCSCRRRRSCSRWRRRTSGGPTSRAPRRTASPMRLGAPVTVTAQVWLRKPSSASNPSRNLPFDMVDGVDQPGIHLDLPAADHLDPAGLADPRLVVAVHVGTHGQFGLVLGRVEQRPDLGGVARSASAPRAMVPEIGQVSIRRPSTRTYISGDAATRNSPSPRLISAP